MSKQDNVIRRWKLTSGKHFISSLTPIVIGRLKVANLMYHSIHARIKHTCNQCGKTISPGPYIMVTTDTRQRKSKQHMHKYHIGCAPVKFEFK